MGGTGDQIAGGNGKSKIQILVKKPEYRFLERAYDFEESPS
jgi:hypothetical protein